MDVLAATPRPHQLICLSVCVWLRLQWRRRCICVRAIVIMRRHVLNTLQCMCINFERKVYSTTQIIFFLVKDLNISIKFRLTYFFLLFLALDTHIFCIQPTPCVGDNNVFAERYTRQIVSTHFAINCSYGLHITTVSGRLKLYFDLISIKNSNLLKFFLF